MSARRQAGSIWAPRNAGDSSGLRGPQQSLLTQREIGEGAGQDTHGNGRRAIRRLQDGLVAESLDGSGSHFVGASAEDLVAAVEAQVADPSRFMMRSIVPIAPSVEEG